jgi:hypothetical protein
VIPLNRRIFVNVAACSSLPMESGILPCIFHRCTVVRAILSRCHSSLSYNFFHHDKWVTGDKNEECYRSERPLGVWRDILVALRVRNLQFKMTGMNAVKMHTTASTIL